MPGGTTTISQALIAKLGAEMSAFRRGLQRANRMVDSAGARMRRVFKRLSLVVVALGAAITAVGVKAVKMAAEFEKSMAEVTTLIDSSREQTARLTAQVTEMALRFGKDVNEQARALYQIISAGATEAAQSMMVLTQANLAALAGITDVAVAAEAIMRVLNAYQMSATEAGRVSDILFQIVRKGVTTFGELAPVIGRVTGTAASLGVSFEEVAAALIVATKALKIEEAIVGLNQLFVTFANRTQDTIDAAEALEIQFDASALSIKGLAGVLKDVIQALDIPIKELEKIAAAGDDAGGALERVASRAGVTTEVVTALFPNVRALRVALALLRGEGELYEQALEDANAAQGATDEAARKMAATFSFLSGQVKQQLNVAFIELGRALMPVAEQLVGAFGRIARATREWIAANRELIAQKVQAALEGIVRAIGFIGEKLISVVEFFIQHPIAGQLGLIGLVFLGPMGAAVAATIGGIIDTLIEKLGGPQTVLDATLWKLEQLERKREALQRQIETAPAIVGTEAVQQQLDELDRQIAGVERTLARFGPEMIEDAEQNLGGLLEKFRTFMTSLRSFTIEGGPGARAGLPEAVPGAEPMTIAEKIAAAAERAAGPVSLIINAPWQEKVTAPMEKASQFAHDWSIHSEEAAHTITDRVVGALVDVGTGVRNVSQAVMALGKAILRSVVGALIKAVVQATILRGIMAAFGLPVGPGMRAGGVVRKAQHGMVLPPFAPAGFGGGIPIMAHPGEAVLTRRTVQAMGGGQAITRLNREPAMAIPQASRVQVDVQIQAEHVPEPADYGIIASKPQVLRLFSEMVRAARDAGVRV